MLPLIAKIKDYGPLVGIEAFCLNEKYEVPKVEPLREEHLDRFSETLDLAFKNDPMQHYLRDTPDAKKSTRLQRKFVQLLRKKYMKIVIKRKLAYTVGEGYSGIISVPPEKDVKQPSLIERIIDSTTVNIIMLMHKTTQSPEQRHRLQETQKKFETLTNTHIPEGTAKDMLYIETLATHPSYQEKGYASALLDTVLFGADLRGRAVYLHTGNPVNIGFYETFGFQNVGEALLGTDNPTWHEQPVRIMLMVRKTKSVVDVDA